MTVRACPIGVVDAPAATVWAFLEAPGRLDLWWDAHVERAEPPGPMTTGQRIHATTREVGRKFQLQFEVDEVDAERRRLRLAARLPLGIVDHATLVVTPLDASTCRLSFG